MNLNKLLYDPEDFGITKYEWRADGKLDTFHAVDLSNRGLDCLPFSFGKIKGGLFNLSNNLLDESSIPDLPESCCQLMLSRNKFKNLNGFHTKTNEIFIKDNPLCSLEGLNKSKSFEKLYFGNTKIERIEWVKNFKLTDFWLNGCDNIKDWEFLPFVKKHLALEGSSIESIDCLKNKNLEILTASNTKIESVSGLSVKFLLIERTNVKTLIDLETCPEFIRCDKKLEQKFFNELKEKFFNSFNLTFLNRKLK